MKIVITHNGKPVDEARPKDCAVHSDYVIPKMANDNFGPFQKVFTTNPTNSTTLVTSFDFSEYDYLPMVLVLMEDVTQNPGEYTNIGAGVWWIASCFNVDFLQRASITSQYMYGVINRTAKRFEIYYTHSNSTDAGFAGTPCPVTVENMTGRVFNFKFYIFAEGDDDVDIERVSVTI